MRLLLLLFASALLASAHVGNPDVYLDAQAGPYRLFITVRPPQVIPGVASIEVRSSTPGLQSLNAVPVPLTAEGAKWAPVPDRLKQSASDPQFFTGSLWIMAAGSWQVRLQAQGTAGAAMTAVPVPSVPLTTKRMDWGLGAVLFGLMTLLVVGLISIAGAAARESKLPAGQQPSPADRSRARRTTIAATVVLIAVLLLGRAWWNNAEASYRENIYKPTEMAATLTGSGHLQLRLTSVQKKMLYRPALFARDIDDLVPDHDHLMHLYAIRKPGLDVVFHLHPQLQAPGVFALDLPAMPEGAYRLYADIVHANGFPETLVANIDVPENMPDRPLGTDDATGTSQPWQEAPVDSVSMRLPDGYTMRWLRPDHMLKAREPQELHFALFDPQGQPAHDMGLYLGMLGHAAFVKTDGTAFAHVHPAGSVAMASLTMAQQQLPDADPMAGMDHHAHGAIPNEVLFPYGFPSTGRYRIIVQMKHGSTVETGIFDTVILPS